MVQHTNAACGCESIGVMKGEVDSSILSGSTIKTDADDEIDEEVKPHRRHYPAIRNLIPAISSFSLKPKQFLRHQIQRTT